MGNGRRVEIQMKIDGDKEMEILWCWWSLVVHYLYRSVRLVGARIGGKLPVWAGRQHGPLAILGGSWVLGSARSRYCINNGEK